MQRLPSVSGLRKWVRGAVESIDPGELERLLRERPVFVLDLRSAPEFYDGHIPGARHTSFETLLADAEGFPKSATIVTVCKGGDGTSEEAAKRLRKAGWFSARWLKGGYLGWAQAGFADDASVIASS